jgi:predicted nuclease of predicted toxin-antitoxin system
LECESVDDVALRGHSDEGVLAFAHRDDRILLTHDRDFLNDRQFPPNRNPGVVILPGANGNDERLVTGLMDLLVTLTPYRENLRNCKAVFHADRTVAITLRDFHSGKLETPLFRLSPGHPVEVLSE